MCDRSKYVVYEYAILFIPLECSTRILIDSMKRGVGTAVNRVHLKAHLLLVMRSDAAYSEGN